MFMERKIKPFKKEFIMPSLFLDDLAIIEEIILTELKPSEYKVETENYVYKNISSFKEKPTIAELKISAYGSNRFTPQLRINFGESSATIEAGDDDLKTIGAITKIADIITKRERKLLFFFIKISILLALIPIILLVIVLPPETDIGPIKLSLALVCALLASFLISWISYKLRFNYYSQVKLVNSSEKKNFFVRKKDRLLEIIISAVVGSLLTIITAFLIHYFTPTT